MIEQSEPEPAPAFIRSTGSGQVIQQFGLAPYTFFKKGKQLEIEILFEEPFSDTNYVITAICDNPECYVSIFSKSKDRAILNIVRSRGSFEPEGYMNWIAIGR
ncbi:WIAG-tail domain [Paenibacillus lupini]